MKKKAILFVSMIACLVAFVPLVLAQNQNGGFLQTQDQTQLQIRDCDESCITGGTACNGCQQNQTQQCLQTCDCDNACNDTGICDETCNATQTQTRQRLCQQEGIQAGLIGGQQHCGQGFQGKNCQAP